MAQGERETSGGARAPRPSSRKPSTAGSGSPSRRRLAIYAALIVIAYGAVWFGFEWGATFACDGDGGVPYAARDSTVGRLCDVRSSSAAVGWAWVAVALAGPLTLLVGAAAAVRRRRRGLLTGSLVIAVAAGAVSALPFTAPSNTCSARDEAAWRAAVQHESRGEPVVDEPPDCEHY
jgi:hypothetical protein